MVKMKKKTSDNGDVVRKFIESLAQQLISESEDEKSLLESSNLEEVLRRVTEDLPSGKLRSTLLQQEDFSSFVVALQVAIKATRATTTDSVSIEDEVTPISFDSLGETLLTDNCWKKVESGCSNGKQAQELSAEVKRRFLSCKDPPLSGLWAIAAQSIRWDGNESETCSSLLWTKALLGCLKPLIVGHTSSPTAVAALAPVVLVMFQAVQESSKPLQLSVGERASNDTTSSLKRAQKDIKTLQTMVREVLSFIVVCRSKEKSSNDAFSSTPRPCLSDLWNGFSCLLRSVKLKNMLAQSDVLSVTERLKLLFPYFPESMLKALKRPHFNVNKLSEVVTAGFVLMQLILEVFNWRNKRKMHVGKTEALHERFTARMRAIAIQSVAAADRRNDVMLDLLLSGLSVDNTLLDDKEKAFINVHLYRALLVEDPQFGDMVTASTSKAELCKTFLKKVAVARKTIDSYRPLDEQNQSVDLLCRLHMLPEFVQWLKTAKMKQKPPENAILSRPRILMGWLLNLEDTDFKEIFDRVSIYASKRLREQERQILEGDDLSNSGEYAQKLTSTRDIHDQVEPEALFFVDTLGEAEAKSPAAGHETIVTVSAVKKGEKSRKRRCYFTDEHVLQMEENIKVNKQNGPRSQYH